MNTSPEINNRSNKPFTLIAMIIFAMVSLLHLLRLVYGWEVIINGIVIPQWVSVGGFVVPGGLVFLVHQEMNK